MRNQHESLKETKELISFLYGCQLQDIPLEVQIKAKLCLLDAVGAAIAGPSTMEPVRIVYDLAKKLGPGPVTLLGDGAQVQVLAGAMANGVSAMALDLGDVHRDAFFHASAGIIPAILATSEEVGSVSGKDILLATALGIETGIRIALSVNPELRLRGLDTTSQCGIFGAAAGSLKILGADMEQFLNGLALAGTQSSGDIQYIVDGDWSKCLHPGKGSSDGVLAAYLAHKGYVGPHNILEGRYGFPMSAAGVFHSEQITKGLGRDWRVLEMGMKIHAACRFSNAAIDAALEIKSSHDIDAKDIRAVRVRMGSLGVDQLGNKKIQSFYDGQMSAPFLVSVALQKGRANFRDVLEGISDERVKALLQRVDMKVDEEIGETSRDTIVEIDLENEKILTVRKNIPRGEPELPLEQKEIESKFLELVDTFMPEKDARALLDKILNLERLGAIEELFA